MVDVSDPVLPLVVADAGAPQLHIVAPDPLTVAGRVADARGRPVVKYAMRGMRRPVGVTVNAYQGDRKAAWDFVDRDGRFELGGLLPGPVRLEVEAGEEFVPLELQASAGDRDLELALQRKP